MSGIVYVSILCIVSGLLIILVASQNRKKAKIISSYLENRRREVTLLKEYTSGSLKAFDSLPVKDRSNFAVGFYYSNVPEEWKKSAFVIHRFFISAHTTDTLNPKSTFLLRGKNGIIASSYHVYIALVCKSFSVTEKGLELYLEDPYSSVVTSPINGLTIEIAKRILNKIIFIDCYYEPQKGILNRISFFYETNCYGDGQCDNKSPKLVGQFCVDNINNCVQYIGSEKIYP